MIVAGIGCRAGVSAVDVETAIEAAMLRAAPLGTALNLIAAPAAKGHEAGIIAAAAARGIPLVLVEQSDLEAASPRTLTRSARALSTMNVHSVAEAAALAGAGRSARLLGPRVAVGPVTCALAMIENPL